MDAFSEIIEWVVAVPVAVIILILVERAAKFW